MLVSCRSHPAGSGDVPSLQDAGSRAVSQPQLSTTLASSRRACRLALLDVFLKIEILGPCWDLPWPFSRTSREAAPKDSPASETLSSYASQRVAIWLLHYREQPSYRPRATCHCAVACVLEPPKPPGPNHQVRQGFASLPPHTPCPCSRQQCRPGAQQSLSSACIQHSHLFNYSCSASLIFLSL